MEYLILFYLEMDLRNGRVDRVGEEDRGNRALPGEWDLRYLRSPNFEITCW